MRNAMRLARIWFSLASISFALGIAQGQICAPGKAGCTSPVSSLPLVSLPQGPSAHQCTVPGTWADSFGAIFTVNQNLTGLRKQPYCNSPHSLTITLQGNNIFFVQAAWSGGFECVAYTENMTFG